MSIPEPQRREGPGCLKVGLIGCGVVAVLFVLSMFGFAYYFSRNLGFRNMVGCSANMTEVTQALQRYETRNGSYPSDLSELVPTFLSKPQALRCPAEKTPSGDTSYSYIQPSPGAPANTVVLICKKHSMFGKPIALNMQKNGKMQGSEHKPR